MRNLKGWLQGASVFKIVSDLRLGPSPEVKFCAKSVRRLRLDARLGLTVWGVALRVEFFKWHKLEHTEDK